jgi:hypothetical protein
MLEEVGTKPGKFSGSTATCAATRLLRDFAFRHPLFELRTHFSESNTRS